MRYLIQQIWPFRGGWIFRFAGCLDIRRSISGCVFLLAPGAISWMSMKQGLVTSSTMKPKFVACFEATTQVVWLHDFITGLRIVDSMTRALTINCDNSAALFFTKNKKIGIKSNHIDIILLYRRKWGNKHLWSTLEHADAYRPHDQRAATQFAWRSCEGHSPSRHFLSCDVCIDLLVATLWLYFFIYYPVHIVLVYICYRLFDLRWEFDTHSFCLPLYNSNYSTNTTVIRRRSYWLVLNNCCQACHDSSHWEP